MTITWWEKNGQNDLKVSSSFHQSRSKLSFLSLLLYHKIKSHQIRYRNKKVKLYFIHKLHLFFIWYNYDLKSKCILRNPFWHCKEKLLKILILNNCHKWKWKKSLFWHLLQIFWFSFGESDKIVILRFLIVLEEEEEEKGRYIGGGGLLEIITTSAGTERIISCKLQLLLIVWRYCLTRQQQATRREEEEAINYYIKNSHDKKMATETSV